MQISQLLRHKGRDVATIDGAESVRTALALLAEKGIGALVVSSDGRRDRRHRLRAGRRPRTARAGRGAARRAGVQRDDGARCTPARRTRACTTSPRP